MTKKNKTKINKKRAVSEFRLIGKIVVCAHVFAV